MRIAILSGLLASGLSLACADTKVCTANAVESLVIKVVDADGVRVCDASVLFSLNGGPERPAYCGNCMCGVDAESPGTYVLKASDGTRSAEETVTVEADECHVMTEYVTLQLR